MVMEQRELAVTGSIPVWFNSGHSCEYKDLQNKLSLNIAGQSN